MKIEEAYKILGLQPGCSISDVKAAYRELCKVYHPDATTGGDETKLRQILEAKEILLKSIMDNNFADAGYDTGSTKTESSQKTYSSDSAQSNNNDNSYYNSYSDTYKDEYDDAFEADSESGYITYEFNFFDKIPYSYTVDKKYDFFNQNRPDEISAQECAENGFSAYLSQKYNLDQIYKYSPDHASMNIVDKVMSDMAYKGVNLGIYLKSINGTAVNYKECYDKNGYYRKDLKIPKGKKNKNLGHPGIKFFKWVSLRTLTYLLCSICLSYIVLRICLLLGAGCSDETTVKTILASTFLFPTKLITNIVFFVALGYVYFFFKKIRRSISIVLNDCKSDYIESKKRKYGR